VSRAFFDPAPTTNEVVDPEEGDVPEWTAAVDAEDEEPATKNPLDLVSIEAYSARLHALNRRQRKSR
jgi:hypothetical protein